MKQENNREASPPSNEMPRRVVMLIYQGVAPLDVAGPLQVFGVSNFLAKQKLYDVVTVAPTSAPVPTPLGFAFMPTCGMAELALPVDTLLVSGGGGPDAGTTPEILDWLRLATPQSRRFGSVCTGAFALGAPACSTASASRRTGRSVPSLPGRSWPSLRAASGALSRAVSEALRRPVAIFDRAEGAILQRARDPESPAMVR